MVFWVRQIAIGYIFADFQRVLCWWNSGNWSEGGFLAYYSKLKRPDAKGHGIGQGESATVKYGFILVTQVVICREMYLR